MTHTPLTGPNLSCFPSRVNSKDSNTGSLETRYVYKLCHNISMNIVTWCTHPWPALSRQLKNSSNEVLNWFLVWMMSICRYSPEPSNAYDPYAISCVISILLKLKSYVYSVFCVFGYNNITSTIIVLIMCLYVYTWPECRVTFHGLT